MGRRALAADFRFTLIYPAFLFFSLFSKGRLDLDRHIFWKGHNQPASALIRFIQSSFNDTNAFGIKKYITITQASGDS